MITSAKPRIRLSMERYQDTFSTAAIQAGPMVLILERSSYHPKWGFEVDGKGRRSGDGAYNSPHFFFLGRRLYWSWGGAGSGQAW